MPSNGNPLGRETEALRSIQAEPDAKARLIRTLSDQPKAGGEGCRNAPVGWVFAVAFAVILTAFMLVPKRASAKSVLQAIQSIPAYRVRSYEKIDGRMVLAGETSINGASRKLVLFDPAGKPVSDKLSDSVQAQASAAVAKALSTPAVGPQQDTSLQVSSATFEDKKYVEGPVIVKGIVHHGPHGRPFVVMSGLTCIDEMMDLLRTAEDWTVDRGVRYHGLRLDKYTCQGWGDFLAIYVDPATNRPLYVHIQDAEDAFDYGRP